MKTYLVSPLDTWFFRDGRPYNMNESSQVDVRSMFPPSAYTVAGAIRASIARSMGWTGKSADPWSDDIKSVLGNGRDDLGEIRFQGPYLFRERDGVGELLLPVPFHLLGKRESYSLRWNSIPGDDEEDFIKILKIKCYLDWSREAEIEKSEDGKTIQISKGEESVSLDLNHKNTEVIIHCDSGKVNRIKTEMRDGEVCFSMEGWSFTRLCPGSPIDCDLGENVALPSAGEMKGMKILDDYYLSAEDFEKVLAGESINCIHPISGREKDGVPGELWELEYSVGLKRNPQSLTTEDRALFSKHHIRLAAGVSLMMRLEGPARLPEPESLLPLGGENRMCCVRAMASEPAMPRHPALKIDGDKIRFTVTHITPAYLGSSWPGPGSILKGVPGRVVSACIERPLLLGGWDSIHRTPLPLRAYVPAGSTWFCEGDAKEKDDIERLHLSHIGEDSGFGFGQVAIGLW